MRPGRAAAPTLAAALAFALSGLGAAPAAGAATGDHPTARPNIVLLTVASLRADRLGCYGAARPTPAIDGLAARGIRYTRAYAASPSTSPSMGSLMTGTNPSVHGILHDLGGRLDDGARTLAETLSAAGFATAAVTGSARGDSDTGLDRGFATYDDTFPGLRKMVAGLSKERRAEEVVRQGIAYLEQAPAGRPFFLWLDFYDTHYDYDPPRPVAGGDAYDGELAHLDGELRRFLQALEKRGLERRTTLVLAGLHGEGAGAHDELGHGVQVYESTIKVPLIVVPAGSRRKQVVDRPVGLIDVAPTLLRLSGIDAPPAMIGSPLPGVVAAGKGTGGTEAGVYLSESWHPWAAYGWSPIFAIIDGDRKLIRGTFTEAFDLKSDPGETKPIIPLPPWAADLEAARPVPPVPVVDAAVRRRVADESDGMGFRWEDSPLCLEKQRWPDPREQTRLVDPLFRARVDFEQGIVGRAARIAEEQVLTSDPANFTALELVIFVGVRNRWGEAIRDSLEMFRCNYPFRGAPYHYFAHFLQHGKEPALALRALSLFALLEPWNEEPEYDLAAQYASEKRLDLALEHLKRAIALGADDFEAIRKDPRMHAIREHPGFAAALSRPGPPPRRPAE